MHNKDKTFKMTLLLFNNIPTINQVLSLKELLIVLKHRVIGYNLTRKISFYLNIRIKEIIILPNMNKQDNTKIP